MRLRKSSSPKANKPTRRALLRYGKRQAPRERVAFFLRDLRAAVPTSRRCSAAATRASIRLRTCTSLHGQAAADRRLQRRLELEHAHFNEAPRQMRKQDGQQKLQH